MDKTPRCPECGASSVIEVDYEDNKPETIWECLQCEAFFTQEDRWGRIDPPDGPDEDPGGYGDMGRWCKATGC